MVVFVVFFILPRQIMMRTLLSLTFVCLIHFLEGIRDENMRSSYFNIMPRHRLTGHLITTTTADSELTCAHKCLRNEQCKSCNFQAIPQKIGICQLNSKTLRSQTYDPALIYDENFVFISLENVSFTQNLPVKRYFCSPRVHLLTLIIIIITIIIIFYLYSAYPLIVLDVSQYYYKKRSK